MKKKKCEHEPDMTMFRLARCKKCGAEAMEQRYCKKCGKRYCVLCFTGNSVFDKKSIN